MEVKIDTAYVAGFFDGEGCISISHYVKKDGNHNFSLRVQITQTNLEVLELIKKEYGGFISPIKTRKAAHSQAWVWVLGSLSALNFLKTIVPHLVVKKEQAEVAIEYQQQVTNHGFRTPLTVDDILQRSNYKKQLEELKHE